MVPTDVPRPGTDVRSLPMLLRTVDLDGPVALADFGGDGPPIVLIHGIDGSHANFDAVGPMFARIGHTYAVDLIGFGETPPAGRTSDLRSNRQLLVRLLDEVIDGPATVLGTSMGGLLAMLVAHVAPRLVDRMVLVGPGQPYPKGVPINWGFALAYVALATPWLGRVVARRRFSRAATLKADASLQLVCHRPERIPPSQRHAYVAMAHRRADMPWAPTAFLEASRSMVHELRRTDGYDRFIAELEPPTLLIHGGRDRLVVPEASRRLARLRPDWRLEELRDVGHSPQLESPELLVDLVADWLDRAPTRTAHPSGAGR